VTSMGLVDAVRIRSTVVISANKCFHDDIGTKSKNKITGSSVRGIRATSVMLDNRYALHINSSLRIKAFVSKPAFHKMIFKYMKKFETTTTSNGTQLLLRVTNSRRHVSRNTASRHVTSVTVSPFSYCVRFRIVCSRLAAKIFAFPKSPLCPY